ncbi:MAG TPA: head maturation protease, ClpP-related [Caproicibacter sp.]|nr:head maturation protease, ClpP-related [Caproicibacter sp.]
MNLAYENPKTHVKSTGRIEIKSQSPGSADLYFYGDICSSTWDLWQQEDMCPQDVADFLNSLTGVNAIDIYINSGGGDSFAGLAIYNMLKRNPASKTVHIDGLAASAASIIAMAGDTIITPPGAQIMIHNPWTFAAGNANDLRQIADSLDVIGQGHLDVYMANVVDGVTAEQIKSLMDAETWLTGTMAQQYFKNIDVQGEQVAASLDTAFMSRYQHVPKSLVKPQKPAAKLPKSETVVHDGIVPSNISTETAPEDQAWSKPTLADFTDKTWDELTDQEKRDIAGHYAWSSEMPPDAFGSLKFPHHDPKTHKVVFAGLSAAAARIDAADIPDADVPKVKQHFEDHYHAFGKKAPWEQDDSKDESKQKAIAIAKATLILSK